VFDKNTSYNGIKINGPSLDEKPKKKGADEELEAGQSSDDEIINAVNQYPTSAVTLSVYDDKNLAKKKFLKQYYNTLSTKRDLAVNRVTMIYES